MAAMIVMCSPLSGRIVGAQGPRLPLIAAGIATTAGGIMLTRLAADTSFSYLIVSYVAFGIGTGLVNPAITNNAVSGMPASQTGIAAGIASTSRQVGSALGVTIIGSAVLSALHGPLRPGFADASHAGSVQPADTQVDRAEHTDLRAAISHAERQRPAPERRQCGPGLRQGPNTQRGGSVSISGIPAGYERPARGNLHRSKRTDGPVKVRLIFLFGPDKFPRHAQDGEKVTAS
jgi:hypothetical protein